MLVADSIFSEAAKYLWYIHGKSIRMKECVRISEEREREREREK